MKKFTQKLYSKTSPSKGKARAPDRVVMALAALGMAITAYLLLRESAALWGLLVYTLVLLSAGMMPPTLKRWRRLTSLVLIGMAISLYLTVVGILDARGICPGCIASLATSAVLLGVLLGRHPESAPGMAWPMWGLQGVVVIAVVVGLLHLFYSDLLTSSRQGQLEALAVHLDESGAKYYGAWWCPSCQQQGRLFRSSSDQLPFVECSTGGRGSPMTQRCRSLGISRYPTWIIDGRRYTGVQQPDELARYSGFQWE